MIRYGYPTWQHFSFFPLCITKILLVFIPLYSLIFPYQPYRALKLSEKFSNTLQHSFVATLTSVLRGCVVCVLQLLGKENGLNGCVTLLRARKEGLQLKIEHLERSNFGNVCNKRNACSIKIPKYAYMSFFQGEKQFHLFVSSPKTLRPKEYPNESCNRVSYKTSIRKKCEINEALSKFSAHDVIMSSSLVVQSFLKQGVSRPPTGFLGKRNSISIFNDGD